MLCRLLMVRHGVMHCMVHEHRMVHGHAGAVALIGYGRRDRARRGHGTIASDPSPASM